MENVPLVASIGTTMLVPYGYNQAIATYLKIVYQ